MDRKHAERFLEFLVIGVLFGTAEDLLAVKLASGAPLDLRVIGIVLAVSIPFAAFSELWVDREEFAFYVWLREKSIL